ncbi:hypothetical protein STEG23_011960 [Scotinomys teguina]
MRELAIEIGVRALLFGVFVELLPINKKREKPFNRKMGKDYEQRSDENTETKSTFQHVTSVEMQDMPLKTA